MKKLVWPLVLLSRLVFANQTVCTDVSSSADPAASASRAYYQGKGIYHGVYDKALALLPWAQELRGKIVSRLKPMDGIGRMLDLGCGTGRIGLATKERYPDVRLFGVDFSPDMAKVAIENGYPVGNVISGNEVGNLQRSDWAKHFEKNSFDNITMNMVAYMLSDAELQRLFHEVHGLLNNNGRFVLTVLGDGESGPALLKGLSDQWAKVPEITPDEHTTLMHANTDLVAKARRHRVDQVARMGELAGLKFHYDLVGDGYGGFTKVLVFEKQARLAYRPN